MPNAARITDQVLHDNPHCHVPTHAPPAATPPHPMAPHNLVLNGAPTVMVNNLMCATMGTQSEPCMKIGCVPNGPGVVTIGSATVMACNKPIARVGDLVMHNGCVAPVPSPT